jgi:hypothetical protein
MRAPWLLALALGLGPGTPAPAADTAARDRLTRALDALLAHERPGGGWTYGRQWGRPVEPGIPAVRLMGRLAPWVGLAPWDVVVVRSPGTPAGGLVLLAGHRQTGRAEFLAAARRAGDLLVGIQLASGGWVSEMPVRGTALAGWFRAIWWKTSIDDDITPGAARLLLRLWEATGEVGYRQAAERALAFLLRAQLPAGAWPGHWRPGWVRRVWPTFADLPTLNDGATSAALETLLVGARVLGREDLRAAARRAGEWILRVQRPAPQAGWAQQYDVYGRAVPARVFEPAALAAWESRYALEALLALAADTGDARYCAAVAAGVRWLRHAALRPGCWARFYTLGADTPLYVGPDGAPVATPAQGRSSYNWTGDFGIPALLERVGAAPVGAGAAPDRPVAGDPGPCAGDPPHGFDRNAPDDPRAMVARAWLALAALEPAGPPPCARGRAGPEG